MNDFEFKLISDEDGHRDLFLVTPKHEILIGAFGSDQFFYPHDINDSIELKITAGIVGDISSTFIPYKIVGNIKLCLMKIKLNHKPIAYKIPSGTVVITTDSKYRTEKKRMIEE